MSEVRNQTGHFLLSLDTELAWGHHHNFRPEMFSADGGRERQAIELILEALDEFNIKATWAVVGHLFYGRCEECRTCPVLEWEGKYPWFEQVYKNNQRLWYGKDIIESLLSRGSMHEIGYHGYTHRVFEEKPESERDVRTEIQEWLRKAGEVDLAPGAVIFPRNVVGYRDVFKEYGFTCYRGLEPVPRAHSLRVVGKVLKHVDCVLALSTPSLHDPQMDVSGLVNLPASQYLFGFNRTLEMGLDYLGLHTRRMRRIVKGVREASRTGKTFHLWAHPYEFQTPKDFDKLRYVLAQVAEEVSTGRMRSLGMTELARMATAGLVQVAASGAG